MLNKPCATNTTRQFCASVAKIVAQSKLRDFSCLKLLLVFKMPKNHNILEINNQALNLNLNKGIGTTSKSNSLKSSLIIMLFSLLNIALAESKARGREEQ